MSMLAFTCVLFFQFEKLRSHFTSLIFELREIERGRFINSTIGLKQVRTPNGNYDCIK